MTLTRRLLTYRKRLRRLWLTLLLVALPLSFVMTAGCAPKVVTKLDVCKGWEPIYVGSQDVLTDQTAKAILSHDQYGLAQGCWSKPKAKKA
jgi:hypothetical protein